jgi:uncharacterized protein
VAHQIAHSAARRPQGPRHRAGLSPAVGAERHRQRRDADGVRLDAPSSGKIAGGVVGLGAAEVERRELSDAQIRELLRAEIDERLTAARQAAGGGHGERATVLRAEAAVLTNLLGDV